MERILERFIKYVKIDTTSSEETGTLPSTEGQRVLAQVLKKELEELGVSEVSVTDDCFVLARIPASAGHESAKKVGLLAHLDTAPDCSGKDVKPMIHKAYDGGVLQLEHGISIDPETYPELLRYIGDDIVTSDGSTLLGGDDKAGIAIIMDAVENLMNQPDCAHGEIKIAFTPDEELSPSGVSALDVEAFGADFGITVDGDGIGELNYETFNGCWYLVKIRGNNIHPSEAKGKMINASTLAMEFDSLLPRDQRAEYTEGHQGFVHLYEMNGTVESASLSYILRDFSKEGLTEKQKILENAAETINRKYGYECITLSWEHEYSNPYEEILKIEGLKELCEKAFRECGIEPVITPIRGGTDGSTLVEKGLPCPNLFIGGHNYHSTREYVSVNAMKKSAEILLKLISLLA